MAWILVPGKMTTEAVEDGEIVERMCGACGRDAEFAEHEGPRGQRLMKCGACGALFRSGEAASSASPVDTAVDTAVPMLERASGIAKGAIEKAGEAIGRIKENLSAFDDEPPTLRDDEPTITDDDPIKEELLRRFAELEKRQKKP